MKIEATVTEKFRGQGNVNIEAIVTTSKDIHTSGLSKLLKKSKWNGMFHQRFQRSYGTQGDRYGSSSYYLL